MQVGFDKDRYIEMQSQRIRERIEQFGGKLYLEFGGKLFDDYHASRVLPGFEPDLKARMLTNLADYAEVLVALNANDIEEDKRRSDLGIPYADDALRLLDIFSGMGIAVGGIVITRFSGQPHAEAYQKRVEAMGIPVYRHYPIDDYPTNVDLIVSDEGFGKNEFARTTKPLVVVTAPGPGSGKLAVCLSQIYHEYGQGVQAGYAKFETFPVWNLPLKHPVNIAYEAATADLDDRNVIDHYHLDAYGKVTVNYNRDVDTFPVLKSMMDRIVGKSPYESPTDMGVNMVGYCISDNEVCCNAAKAEIVRRYFTTAERLERTGVGAAELKTISMLMNEAGVTKDFSPARAAALKKEEETNLPAAAMELPDGSVVTGKTSDLLGCASSLLLNALKRVAGVDKDIYVVSDDALKPICDLKVDHLNSKNRRLHSDETLIALSISSATNPLAASVIASADKLKGCDAYFSVIISPTDERIYRKLGINVCCEPKFEKHTFYHR